MNNKSAAASTSIPRFALHLGRGIRRMENKKKGPREMRALPWDLSSYFPRFSLLHVKNRRPRSSNVCKNSDFQVRDQGFEPWTP